MTAIGDLPLGALVARVGELERQVGQLSDSVTHRLDQALTALELVIDDDPTARRRLASLRTTESYAAAFTDPDPLISVLIPTWNRSESLCERTIPSVLAQTHANIEVIVVGDASPSPLVDAVVRIDDPRIRFRNRTIRGPYPDDPMQAWCASGTPPLNDGLQQVRGHWIAALGDDDVWPETHLASLLRFARRQRVELALGSFRAHERDGSVLTIESFPPELGATGLQIALWHAGLRFLEFEPAHALFMTPNDWGLIRRMTRIGVTMGHVPDAVVDYTASGRGIGFGGDVADDRASLRDRIITLQDRVSELEALRAGAEAQVVGITADAEAARGELQQQLTEVIESRSWQMTAPMRRVAELRRRLHRLR